MRKLALIGAPTSAGAYAPGQEKAPEAFRRHGLPAMLQEQGWEVRDAGDTDAFRWRPDPSRPDVMNLDAVVRAASDVATRVGEAHASEEVPLVLGGDCTIEIGSVAGAQQDGASVGLVYIDLDVDLNPPAQSDGALDWTVVAHLLGLPGAAAELASLGRDGSSLLEPSELLYVGSDAITDGERATLEKLDLARIPLDEVKAGPTEAGARSATWAREFDRMLVHLDVDVLEYVDFPIAENVRREPGLNLGEVTVLLESLASAANWAGLTITEVNPDHTPDEADSFRRLNRALCEALRPA